MERASHGTNTHAKDDPLGDRFTEAAATAHEAVDHVAALGHRAVNKAESAVKPAERWVGEKADVWRSFPQSAADGARQFIVEHPLQSVGFALATGFLLGKWRT